MQSLRILSLRNFTFKFGLYNFKWSLQELITVSEQLKLLLMWSFSQTAYLKIHVLFGFHR